MAGIQIDGVNNKIDFDDDADTSISSATDDTLVVESGGVNIASITAGEFAINEGSANIDFRVESNGNTHMLFVDGGNDFVGIGTSSPEQPLHIKSTAGVRMERFQAGSGGANIDIRKSRNATVGSHTVLQDGDAIGGLTFRGSDGTEYENAAAILSFIDGTPGTNDMPAMLTFSTTADGANSYTERMRIDSNGNVGIGTTSLTSTFHLEKSVHNTAIAVMNNSTSSTPYGIFLTFGGASPDSHTPYFLNCSDSTTNRCIIKSDGDLLNHDNSYGQISDERIKQNITNANSQWDDIKSIKVRNFERKDDIAEYGEGKKVQIGVVAQEVETVSPGLIKEGEPMAEDIKMSSEFGTLYTSDDAETQDAVLYTSSDQAVIDGDKDVGDVKTKSTKQVGDIKSLTGEKVKTVSYSVLYMKAIKALQEAMAKIETLETKVKALEDA